MSPEHFKIHVYNNRYKIFNIKNMCNMIEGGWPIESCIKDSLVHHGLIKSISLRDFENMVFRIVESKDEWNIEEYEIVDYCKEFLIEENDDVLLELL